MAFPPNFYWMLISVFQYLAAYGGVIHFPFLIECADKLLEPRINLVY